MPFTASYCFYNHTILSSFSLSSSSLFYHHHHHHCIYFPFSLQLILMLNYRVYENNTQFSFKSQNLWWWRSLVMTNETWGTGNKELTFKMITITNCEILWFKCKLSNHNHLRVHSLIWMKIFFSFSLLHFAASIECWVNNESLFVQLVACKWKKRVRLSDWIDELTFRIVKGLVIDLWMLNWTFSRQNICNWV